MKDANQESQIKKMFEKYYFQFRDSIYWYVYKKVGTKELSEDITADVFVKLLEHTDIIEQRDENGVRAWLFTVARNKVIDSYRKKGSGKDKVDIESEHFELVTKQEDRNLEDLLNSEQLQFLSHGLKKLEPQEQELIALRFKEELMFGEIAQILGKSEGAVKMMLYRSLEKLKVYLDDQFKPTEEQR